MKKFELILLILPFVSIGCNSKTDLNTLFDTALKNAMVTDKSNIRELVNVSKEDANIKWNETNQVLLTTFHRFPDSYKEGSTITLSWGDSWVVSTKEFSNYYKKNKNEFTNNALLRCKQILGMREDSKNEWFSSYWIDPKYLKRPAYVIDINKQMEITFPEETTSEYKSWFYSQCGYSYYSDKPTPWTRLGYTYDWKGSKDRYGLTEFIIQEKTATALVDRTCKVDDFLKYLSNL